MVAAMLARCNGLIRLMSALLCAVALVGPAGASQDKPLVFGVYPFLSPSQIVSQFAPLAEHLAKALDRPVELRSAKNFGTFIKRTRAGEYDLIFTAPHMGRMAEQQDGYRPLVQTGYRIVVVVLAKKDGAVDGLAGLKGRSLAVGAKLSMTYQITDLALLKHGLALGREVKFIDTASFSNVIEAIMRGEADAGATGTLLWDTAPPEQRAALREIYRSEPVPGFLVLSHPRHDAAFAKRATRALVDFSTTTAGQGYFSNNKQIDFRPLDPATMKQLDPFTKVFEHR
jgi:phosphonate transport system substrate-binding protein